MRIRWSVTALRYGTLPSTRASLYLDWLPADGPDGPQAIDFYFWLLRSDDRVILLDTGFDPAVAARRGRTSLRHPLEVLTSAGVKAEAVDTVILSHFHYDHTGNLQSFPRAQILAPRKEIDFWASPATADAEIREHVEAVDIEWIRAAVEAGRVRSYEGDDELAPGIRAIDLAGHSPGQSGLLVQTEDAPVLLSSDAVHLYDELEHDRLFRIAPDPVAMRTAYATVRRLCSETGAIFVPGHDPATATRHRTAPGTDDLVVEITTAAGQTAGPDST